MIIEYSNQEYLNELNKLYLEEIKPLLDKGYSMTRAFNKVGVRCQKKSRKYKELRSMVIQDGYILQK